MGPERREIRLVTKVFHKFWTMKHLTEMMRNLFCGAFYHDEATYKEDLKAPTVLGSHGYHSNCILWDSEIS